MGDTAYDEVDHEHDRHIRFAGPHDAKLRHLHQHASVEHDVDEEYDPTTAMDDRHRPSWGNNTILSAQAAQDATTSKASRMEITWSTPTMDGTPPSARGGHSAVLANTSIWIFGGHYFGGHGAFVYLNDMHRLDLTTSTWSEVHFHPQMLLPKPRYHHSATLCNGNRRMFVFGGKGEGNQVFRDMFFFDMERERWFQVQWTTDCPLGRFGHAVTCVNDEILVLFGGWDGRKSMQDLWMFDTHHFTWSKPKTRGKPPTERHNHSMVALSNELVMVYGGYTVQPDQLPVYNKDIYLFDMETMQWSRPRLTGAQYPIGTFGQTMSLLDHDLALILGGWSGTSRSPLYMGDKQVKDTMRLLAREERLTSGQVVKSPKANTKKKEQLRQLKTQSPYVFVLDAATMQWYQPISHGIPVSNRYGHSCTLVGPHVFLFGGWDGNRALHQLVVGELTEAS